MKTIILFIMLAFLASCSRDEKEKNHDINLIISGYERTVKVSDVNYNEISGVNYAVNLLGRTIAQLQRDEVWTGGNEFSGCYTENDKSRFINNNGLDRILLKAKSNPNFITGIKEFKKLPRKRQNEILLLWNEPLDKTWAQTGHIGIGTTTAGQEVERLILDKLIELINKYSKFSNRRLDRMIADM